MLIFFFFFQAEDGIRDLTVTGVQTCALPIFALCVICEIAIAACDLGEVLGSAVALKLLFGLPLLAGVILTALGVLLVLALQGRGFRMVEALVVILITMIGACFGFELFFSRPLC